MSGTPEVDQKTDVGRGITGEDNHTEPVPLTETNYRDP